MTGEELVEQWTSTYTHGNNVMSLWAKPQVSLHDDCDKFFYGKRFFFKASKRSVIISAKETN